MKDGKHVPSEKKGEVLAALQEGIPLCAAAETSPFFSNGNEGVRRGTGGGQEGLLGRLPKARLRSTSQQPYGVQEVRDRG
eukprot:1190957-Prorocentrum_minimum.AAC.2